MTDDEERRFTQVDVDRIVQKRLDREQAKMEALEDENSTLKAQVAEYEKASLESLRHKVATDLKLPETLAGRLQGKTEKELRDDAAKLLQEIGPKEPSGAGGNPATETKKPLTKESVKAMTPSEIIERMDDIKAQMRDGTLK